MEIKNFNKVFHNFTIRENTLIGNTVDYPTGGKHIGQLILDCFNENLEHVGHIDGDTDRKVTFRETRDKSIKLANWLQAQGLRKGDIVAINSHDKINAYLPLVSTLFLGGIINPWPLELTLETARRLIKNIGPKLIFTAIDNVQILQEAVRLEGVSIKLVVFEDHPNLISVDQILKITNNTNTVNFKISHYVDENDPAIIKFTSGSTGIPKGAVFTSKAFHHNVMQFIHAPNNVIISKFINITPVGWMASPLCYVSSILNKYTRVLLRDFNPDTLCQAIEKYNVDYVFIKPSNFVELGQSGVLQKYQLENLKLILTGGSRINDEIYKRVKEFLPESLVSKGYGMSEIGTICTQKMNTKYIASSGTIRTNVQIKIQNRDTHEFLGPNQEGEVLMKTPYMMKEYYKNPIATKETVSEDGWLYTGDIGYYDEDGEVYITDRTKDLIKFRGYHIAPSEIEDKLSTHSDVLSAAVVSYPHIVDVEIPIAFVKKRPGSSLTEETLLKMSEELGDYKKLRGGVIFLNELPPTASGKIDKPELRKLARLYVKH